MFMSVDLLTQFQSGRASQANIWMKLDGQPSALSAMFFLNIFFKPKKAIISVTIIIATQ